MKITTTTTRIECTADELRQSNSLSESFCSVLRNCFNGPIRATEDNGEEEGYETDNEED